MATDTDTTKSGRSLAASAGSPPLTVERSHFIAWNEGILMHFESGAGIAVNEIECIAAEEALERGEIVLLREGPKLTGNHIVLIAGCIHERLGMQANEKCAGTDASEKTL